jgi:sensor histidine kinase YesM
VREATHRRQEALRAALAKASGAAAAALVLLALAAYATARRVTGPLGALSAQAERYAAGDYRPAGRRSAFAELEALGETLEAMPGNILTHIEQRGAEERVRGELARAQVQAELDALRAQLSPHFLFNSLNSIAVISTFDAPRASSMIMRLAALYRGILDAGRGDMLPLAAELQIVRDYLALEQMRFEERLAYTIDMAPEAADVPFPGLLAQTLVENAVKHGIAKSREGGRIDVSVTALGAGAFAFRIVNTGAPLGAPSGRGTGLANTRKRLDLLYGEGHGFAVTSGASGETIVSFRFSGRVPS